MKVILSTLIWVLLISGNISAQSKITFLEGSICFTKASGFFARQIPEYKFGFDVGFLRQVKTEKPLFWGMDIYYNNLGSTSATIEEILDFNFVNFDYSTTSNLLGANARMRFYPDIYLFGIEPYMEAHLGYKWFFTNTTKAFSDDAESSDTNLEKGSLSLSYGISLGFNIPISNKLYLNLKGSYLPGLSTPYYALRPENSIVTSTLDGFDLKRSTTDIFRWDLGVTYNINKDE
ncbi:MAG: hypothetical protein IPL08_21215 [Saprospiraceae bacterium]|nr:hypothetical protein [Saprospiraceae bacterium]MBK8670789.1 hypothetical protein [Saprospiraceae bacterium]